jgi:hypothetical protein
LVCDWANSGEAMSAARTTPARIVFIEASPCCSGGHAASNNKTEIELAIFPDSSDFSQKVARAFPLTHDAWGKRDRIRSTAKISLLPPGIIEVHFRSIRFGATGHFNSAALNETS